MNYKTLRARMIRISNLVTMRVVPYSSILARAQGGFLPRYVFRWSSIDITGTTPVFFIGFLFQLQCVVVDLVMEDADMIMVRG